MKVAGSDGVLACIELAFRVDSQTKMSDIAMTTMEAGTCPLSMQYSGWNVTGLKICTCFCLFSVGVRVMRQSHYLKDKSRVALIRGRHKPT